MSAFRASRQIIVLLAAGWLTASPGGLTAARAQVGEPAPATTVGAPLSLLPRSSGGTAGTQAGYGATSTRSLTTGAGEGSAGAGAATGRTPRGGGSVGIIEVNPLAEFSPDSLGILELENGGLGYDIWRDSHRPVVDDLLERLPIDLSSRALRSLARRLLLSRARAPEGDASVSGTAEAEFLSLRVDRLAALGENDAILQLLGLVPGRAIDARMARARLEATLLSGEVPEACRQVRGALVEYHAIVYWQRALIFCQVVSGERDQAMLSLALLRERGEAPDEDFAALIGALIGGEAVPGGATTLTPFHVAAMRVTGLVEPVDEPDLLEPRLLVALATVPALPLDQRAEFAERALALGLVNPDAVLTLYGAFEFASEALADARLAVGDAHGPRARALLYQAALRASEPGRRAEILDFALRRARAEGDYLVAAWAFLPLLSEIEVRPRLAWFAPSAGRALYATGRFEQASAWLMLGRQESIINPQAGRAVTELWPYSHLAGAARLTTEGILGVWRSEQAEQGAEGQDREAFLRGALAALGEAEPLGWNELAQAGDASLRPMPDAELLFALADVSETRRVGETVLLGVLVLGAPGPGESHTMAFSAVLKALRRVGLTADARALAIEAALARGI